jgi:hypothetical protein
LVRRVHRLQDRLKPALAEIDPELARRADDWKEDWRNRLEARWESAARQLTEPDRLETPPEHPGSEIEEPDLSRPVLLGGWFPQKETEDAAHGEEPGDPLAASNCPPPETTEAETPDMERSSPEMPADEGGSEAGEEEPSVEGPVTPAAEPTPELGSDEATPPDVEPVPVVCTIRVGESGDCVASWRKRVRLPPGRYRATLWAKVEGVLPREGDERGFGAGLRLSGQNRGAGLVGTTDWTELAWEFEVTEEQPEIELVAELRGTAGQAWFRTPARLERVIADE